MFPKAPADDFLNVYPTNHTACSLRTRKLLYTITNIASMCVSMGVYVCKHFLKRGLRSNTQLITMSHHKITLCYQFQIEIQPFPNAVVQTQEKRIPTHCILVPTDAVKLFFCIPYNRFIPIDPYKHNYILGIPLPIILFKIIPPLFLLLSL